LNRAINQANRHSDLLIGTNICTDLQSSKELKHLRAMNFSKTKFDEKTIESIDITFYQPIRESDL
jgi:hypothetical protein